MSIEFTEFAQQFSDWFHCFAPEMPLIARNELKFEVTPNLVGSAALVEAWLLVARKKIEEEQPTGEIAHLFPKLNHRPVDLVFVQWYRFDSGTWAVETFPTIQFFDSHRWPEQHSSINEPLDVILPAVQTDVQEAIHLCPAHRTVPSFNCPCCPATVDAH